MKGELATYSPSSVGAVGISIVVAGRKVEGAYG